MGALCALCGLPPVLIATGVWVPPQAASPDNAPSWVIMCAGLAFITAGVAIVLDYGIAGVTMKPDGDFADGTPMWIRVGNLVLGGVIVAAMTAMFGWVAFGSGPRHFSSSLYLPFLPAPLVRRTSELSGRIAFGGATVLMGIMFVACTSVGIQRLRRVR